MSETWQQEIGERRFWQHNWLNFPPSDNKSRFCLALKQVSVFFSLMFNVYFWRVSPMLSFLWQMLSLLSRFPLKYVPQMLRQIYGSICAPRFFRWVWEIWDMFALVYTTLCNVCEPYTPYISMTCEILGKLLSMFSILEKRFYLWEIDRCW